MLSQRLTSELGVILKEEFDLILAPEELEQAATSLVGCFDLLFELEKPSNQENTMKISKNYDEQAGPAKDL